MNRKTVLVTLAALTLMTTVGAFTSTHANKQITGQGSFSGPEPVMTADQLETAVKARGWSAGSYDYTAADAECVELVVKSSGAGTYQCRIDFAPSGGGATQADSRTIIVGSDGSWVSD